MDNSLSNKTFCVMPWISRVVRTNGVLSFCGTTCLGPTKGALIKESGEIYNALTDTLDSPRNSILICQVRKSMLEGRWHPECIQCQKIENSGGVSKRERMNELASRHFSVDRAREFTNIDTGELTVDYKLSDYDLRFGNKCNLMCRTCGPQSSDAWYKEWYELYSDSFIDSNVSVTIKRKKNGKFVDDFAGYRWFENKSFWDEFLGELPHIKTLYFAGGEPLMNSTHENLISECVKRGEAKHIELSYNTNLTIITDKLFAIWRKFGRVDIQASIDGIDRVNDYIRYPSRFVSIADHIKKINKAHIPGLTIRIVCTVSFFNVFYIPEFLDWHELMNYKCLNRKSPDLRLLQRPYGQSIQCMPPRLKNIIKEKYRKFNGKDHYKEILSDIVRFMDNGEYDKLEFAQFAENNCKLDVLRDQKIKNYLSEFFTSLPKELKELFES